MHEAQMNENNHFVTFTYNNEHLPAGGTLQKEDFQKWAKRWRKQNGKFRYFHCGEYGELRGRPHYHACVFGMKIQDLIEAGKTKSGHPALESEELKHSWGKGNVQVGRLTFESAAYTARYIMKKVTGDAAEEHYTDRQTGEIREREYVTMSRRPGIGKEWYDKYKKDVYPRDEIFINGKYARPPKFYDGQYELEDEDEFRKIKKRRVRAGRKREQDNTPERRRTKESLLKRKEQQFARDYEE